MAHHNSNNMGEVDPFIMKRYILEQKMGKGAYGIVWKAMDRKTRRTVALKKCFDAFRNSTDAQRTYREVMYLQKLNGHENIIQLLHFIGPSSSSSSEIPPSQDLYLTFDFMETDLHCVIRAQNILKDIHIKFVIYQLCKAVKYIHSAHLIHRDIKPSNILLNSDCRLKLCDFGLCRSICVNGSGNGSTRNSQYNNTNNNNSRRGGDDGNNNDNSNLNPNTPSSPSGGSMTDYVATRWYRSPEVLMGSKNYTFGIDLWSIGCILGEMISQGPLFPGNSTMNQIERILECISQDKTGDNDDEYDINEIMQSPYANVMMDSLTPNLQRVSLEDLVFSTVEPSLDPAKIEFKAEALDFLHQCLQFNPRKRLSADDALKHPFLQEFASTSSTSDEEDEDIYLSGPIKIDIDDNTKLSASDYKELLYREIHLKKRESRHKLREDNRKRGRFRNASHNVRR